MSVRRLSHIWAFRWALGLVAMGFCGVPGYPIAAQETPDALETFDRAVDWLGQNPGSPQRGSVLLDAVRSAPEVGAAQGLVEENLADVRDATLRGEILYHLGLLQELSNRFADARLSYARAMDADVLRWDAALRRANLAIEAGDAGEAVLLLNRIVNQAPTRDLQRRAAILRARAFLLQGDPQRAYTHARALVGLDDGEQQVDADVPTGLIEPEAFLLLFEIGRSLDDTDLSQWSRRALSRRGLRGPETQILADDGPVEFYPSPSRVLGGLNSSVETPMANRGGGESADERPLDQRREIGDPAESSTAQTVAGVQNGSFRDRENAQYMAEDIRALGFSADVREARVGDAEFFRVLVPFGDGVTAEDAQRTVVELKERGIEGFLVFNETD